MKLLNVTGIRIKEGNVVSISNKQGQVIWQPSEPISYYDMVIEDIYVVDRDNGYNEYAVFADYSPRTIVNSSGETVFIYDSLELELKISGVSNSNFLKPNLGLKRGQTVTIYPYNNYSSGIPVISKDWKIKIVIPLDTAANLVYNDGTWLIGESSIYWKYSPITVELSYNEASGLGTISVEDCDGSGTKKTDVVDFSKGIRFEVKSIDTDVYIDGSFRFNETLDLKNFSDEPEEFSLDFLSRWHTDAMYDNPYFTNASIFVSNTSIWYGTVDDENLVYHDGKWQEPIFDPLITDARAGSLNRVISVDGPCLIPAKLYDLIINQGSRIYEGMLSYMSGRWKFVNKPTLKSLVDYEGGQSGTFLAGLGYGYGEGGFLSRKDSTQQTYKRFGAITIRADSYNDPVLSYSGGSVSTLSEHVIYYVRGSDPIHSDPKWVGEYWKTMNFGDGDFVDWYLWDWIVYGHYDDNYTQNALVVVNEDSELPT